MRLMLPGAWLSESYGMTLQDDVSEFSAFNELKITDILMIKKKIPSMGLRVVLKDRVPVTDCLMFYIRARWWR